MMKTIIASVVLAMSLHACTKFDEQSPVIASVSIDATSGDALQAVAGESGIFACRVRDDENLKQLKLSIKTLSGVHGHVSAASEEPHPFVMVNQGVWDTVLISNLSGQDVLKEYSLIVPDTVSGGWELEVSVLDEAGNLFSEEHLFQIFNPSIPQLGFSNVLPGPVADGKFELALNDSIVFDLAVIGLAELTEVEIKLSRGAESSSTIYAPASNLFELQNFVVNGFSQFGNYTLSVEATDVTGRKNQMKSTITVE